MAVRSGKVRARVYGKGRVAEGFIKRESGYEGSYENKLREGKGGELARECLKEIRNKIKKGKAVKRWEEERVNFMEERG